MRCMQSGLAIQWLSCHAGKHIGKVLIDTSAFPQLPSTSHCLGPKAPLELSAAGRELPSLELEPMLHCRYC